MTAQRICIVTPDLAGPTRNGGIGTHCLQLARLLVGRGDAVTILHTGAPDDADRSVWKDRYARAPGATLLFLDEIRSGPASVPILPHTVRHTIAHHVDAWLRCEKFDVVHFQDWQGNGAVATRARQTGLAHAHTRMIVTAHGSSEWIREGMQEFPSDGREGLIDDALERTALACADVLVCPSRAMRTWLEARGWLLPPDTRVVPLLFDDPDAAPATPRAIAPGALRELVFFGRLETRKGLEPFLAALEQLAAGPHRPTLCAAKLRVHFVGKPHATLRGPAAEAIRETQRRCGDCLCLEIHPDLDHAAAMAFLRARPDALVVIPSLADNLPYAVIECLTLGQPLLAADRGGIPELVDSPAHLVEPTGPALATRLLDVLRDGLPPCAGAYQAARARDAWSSLLDSPPATESRPCAHRDSLAGTPPRPPREPRVSVCIPHYNQISGLAEVLARLEAQTTPPIEVIVVDDGSDSASRPAWDELVRRYAPHGWRFLRQDNTGPAAARNAAAAHASGAALVFCDADNRPHPDMLARLAAAWSRTGADIVTCGFAAYRADASEGWSAVPDFVYSPIGDAPELAVLENFIGDVNLIISRAAFEQLGGFDRANDQASEDWDLLLRATRAGLRLATVPEPLFDYRIAEASHARRHSPRSSAESVWSSLPEWERTHYLRLIRASRGTFDRLPDTQRALHRAEAELRATAQHATHLAQQLKATSAHLEHLQQTQQDTAQHAKNLEGIVDRLRKDLRQLEEARAATESALIAEKHALESARDVALGQVEQLSERAARLSTTIHELKHEILRRNAKIATLETSFSWRVTLPLRYLRRKLLDPRRRRADHASPALLPAIAPPAPPCSPPGLFGLPHSVDEPRSWTLAPRRHLLRGWVFHPNGNELRGIRAVLGSRIIEGVYGLKRLDVAASVRNLPQAEFCGWRIEADLHESDTQLELQALEESGVWLPFFRTGLRIGHDLGPTDLTRYEEWIRVYDTISPETLAAQRVRAAQLERPIRLSLIVPVYNTPERWLRRMIDSVREQTYPHWELCLADDASTAPHVRRILTEAAAADPRIKVCWRRANGHISAASNSALDLATGDYVGLLDHDDELAPHALFEVALALARRPDADLVYSDEDKIDEDGRRFEPYFKPDWNPDLFLGQNYLSHFSVYRTALVREVGGFRTGYEGSQDWDLALRVTARCAPASIVHIPRVLYHWRAIAGSTALELSEKSYPVDAARRALTDHLAARGIEARLEAVPGGHWRVVYPVPSPAPLVSIIIPTRNGLEHLRRCVASIRARTDYPTYEILIVDNDSDDPATLSWLGDIAADPTVRVLPQPGPFNYSAINNAAVRAARGDIVALLNNDLEVITPGWLTEMTSHACREGVGCVGAMLYFPNDHIQHAGVILGLGGVAGHAFRDFPRGTEGVFNRARLVQEFSAVTAACLVVRRSIYLSVDGLDETDLAIAFNDIDFCLKVRRAGFRNIWTPFAELYHHESASRGADDTPEKRHRFDREVEVMLRRWGTELLADPAYNPNLTLERTDFSLAIPPRPPRT